MSKESEIILAADIGGTSARFALFDTGAGLDMTNVRTHLDTARFTSFRELLEAAHAELAKAGGDQPAGGAAGPQAGQSAQEPHCARWNPRVCRAVLAVAGPVERGRSCKPPNIDYAMDLDALPAGLLPTRSVLVNDFAAQAHGCRLFGDARSQEVLPGVMNPSLTQAVAGPGTGLGKAALVPDGLGGYLICGSEGGHAAFPFMGAEEFRFQQFLLEATGEPYVRWESVVSGQGLALVHRFHTGEDASPVEAAMQLTPQSPVCEWYARFLARACRDYVLDVMATGGLFISGGVAARNPVLLEHPAFAREFRWSATHENLLAGVPVRLVHDQDVGLWGAAAFARTL